ncbi:MAG: hypothetical protein IAE87_17495 [Rhodobacteraceae bacterium]|nr:hypothetical protein [Paracoccaceae bacterium]
MTLAATLPGHRRSRGLFARIAHGLGLILALRRERAGLSRLEDHRLADLGLTAAEVRDETARPVWDAPQRWRSHECR